MNQGEGREKAPVPESFFRGDAFDVVYFNEDGFSVRTRNSVRRTLSTHARRTMAPFKIDEPKRFRAGPGFVPKIGLRDVELHGDRLSFDIFPVTFPTIKSAVQLEGIDAANAVFTGIGGVLFTSEDDGSEKIIVQLRSHNNRLWGGVPGASYGGYFDGKLARGSRGTRGTLQPVSEAEVLGIAVKEAHEELGIPEKDLERTRIVGLVHVHTVPHYQFVSITKTSKNYRRIVIDHVPDDGRHFAESFTAIDATPEAIETLLTKVQCPLPPAHAGSFIAAGYMLVVKRDGYERAEEWRKDMEKKIKANYQEIDRIVQHYYSLHPDIAQEQGAGRPPRDIHGYDAHYPPDEQGLPEMRAELKRVGLVGSPKVENSQVSHESVPRFACTQCRREMIGKPTGAISFMRHGETEDNAAGICGGSRDVPMTDKGRAEIREKAHAMKTQGIYFDRMGVSLLGRSQETGYITADELDFPCEKIEVLPWLTEANVGRAQGHPENEEDAARLFERDYFNSLDGPQTLDEFEQGMWKPLNEYVHAHQDGNTLLVAHGFWMKTLVKKARGLSAADTKKYSPPGHGELLTFSVGGTCECGSCFFEEQKIATLQ